MCQFCEKDNSLKNKIREYSTGPKSSRNQSKPTILSQTSRESVKNIQKRFLQSEKELNLIL